MNQRGVVLSSALYVAALCVMIYVGLKYDDISFGLAALTESGGQPFYCNKLLSTGGDESSMVVTFTLFVAPLFIRLSKFSKAAGMLEFGLFILISALVAFALFFLATLDCAQIFHTAFVVPDIALLSALLSQAAATLLLFLLFKSRSR